MKKTLLTFATLATTMISASAFAKRPVAVCDYDTGTKEYYSVAGDLLSVRFHTAGTSAASDYTTTYKIVWQGPDYQPTKANLLVRGDNRHVVEGARIEYELPRYPNQEIGIYRLNDGATFVVRFGRFESSASDSKACL